MCINHEAGSTLCIHTKISFSPSFSPPIADWYLYNGSDKVEACRSVWDSLLNTYPQSFVVHCHEAIGGTVYITKLENVELIDGDIHQECTLDIQLKC